VSAAIRAGAVYVALVFALGFALGTARVLAVAPAIGELLATIVELPIMLAASWLACGRCMRRFDVPPARRARATMGATAFALLMLAELAVAYFGFGRDLATHLARYAGPAAALGLLMQLVFAAMPMIRR
jgi:hypothetical protein